MKPGATTQKPKHKLKPSTRNLRADLNTLEHWMQTELHESDPYHQAIAAQMFSIVANTDGATMTIKDPRGLYVGQIKATLEKLNSLEPSNPTEPEQIENIKIARTRILENILALRADVARATDQLDWHALPYLLSHPDDENVPQHAAARYLAVWPDNEHGRTLDAFSCLCLALWWANTRLGLPPWSISPNDKPEAP